MNRQQKAPVKIVQTAGHDILGKIAPEFARLKIFTAVMIRELAAV